MSYNSLPVNKLSSVEEVETLEGQTIEDFNEKLLYRKEFFQFKYDENRNFKDPNDYDILRNKFFKFRSYQLFMKNLLNPNTPYTRVLLKYMPGLGKTSAAIAISQSFIEIYAKLYQNTIITSGSNRKAYANAEQTTPNVFIIGFTGKNIIKELLKYPEFGFISTVEREELTKIQNQAHGGSLVDVKKYKELYSMYKRRITDKTRGGFYKFFGYQEFVNRLFISGEINLTELENIVMHRAQSQFAGSSDQTAKDFNLEDIVEKYILSGKIQINMQLLAQFENSLLICDEIHNTYNMFMKNNYGVAIQYVLNHHPSLRAVFLSATPINNSPTEVIDVLNYVLPTKMQIYKKQFFKNYRELYPGKLEVLGRLSYGRISFLQDVNPKFFPKQTIVGERRKLRHAVEQDGSGKSDSLPYLSFVACPMSPLHLQTYKAFLASKDIDVEEADDEPEIKEESDGESSEDEPDLGEPDKPTKTKDKPAAKDKTKDKAKDKTKYKSERSEKPKPKQFNSVSRNPTLPTRGVAIPISCYAILDMVFPNPSSPDLGLYRSNEVKSQMLNAPDKWKKENGVRVTKQQSGTVLLGGEWLSKENVAKYSTKAAKILDIIDQVFQKQVEKLKVSKVDKTAKPDQNSIYRLSPELAGEKMLIYHDRVKGNGVLLIQELLKANNILDENSESTDTTRCCVCGGPNVTHDHFIKANEIVAHTFHPSRFVMAHSEINKNIQDVSIAKYNMVENATGVNYKFLVGSKIIRESYDMKDTRAMIIISSPVHISALIQEIGRVNRQGSHLALAVQDRTVDIYILLTTIPDFETSIDTVSPEEYRYLDKLLDYKVIQKIEKEFNKYAIDGEIHRDIIMPPELMRTYFPNCESGDPVESLGSLYYESMYPLETVEKTLETGKMSELTFNAYGYSKQEVITCMYVIKRLFRLNTVYTYEDLWNAVREPPFGLESNPKLFSEYNFIIALNNLVTTDQTYINRKMLNTNLYSPEVTEKLLIGSLFDPNDKYIYIGSTGSMGGSKYKITHVDKYYILFPVQQVVEEHQSFNQRKNIKNTGKGVYSVASTEIANETVIADIESFIRPVVVAKDVNINIDSWLESSKEEYNYEVLKNSICDRYGLVDDLFELTIMIIEQSEEFNTRFLMDIIVELFEHDNPANKTADNELIKFYRNIIKVYEQFRAIIYIYDVLKYKDVARKITSKLIAEEINGTFQSKYPKSQPIGFLSFNSILIYDMLPAQDNSGEMTSNWLRVNKLNMNQQTQYVENDKLIGYMEMGTVGKMKFKTRSPLHIIKKEHKTSKKSNQSIDSRGFERGIVCSTKSKYELLKIAEQLDISVNKMHLAPSNRNNINPGKLKIKSICMEIRAKLILLEITQRQKESKIKYFYLWNEIENKM